MKETIKAKDIKIVITTHDGREIEIEPVSEEDLVIDSYSGKWWKPAINIDYDVEKQVSEKPSIDLSKATKLAIMDLETVTSVIEDLSSHEKINLTIYAKNASQAKLIAKIIYLNKQHGQVSTGDYVATFEHNGEYFSEMFNLVLTE